MTRAILCLLSLLIGAVVAGEFAWHQPPYLWGLGIVEGGLLTFYMTRGWL